MFKIAERKLDSHLRGLFFSFRSPAPLKQQNSSYYFQYVQLD